jgi:hypothetical protein
MTAGATKIWNDGKNLWVTFPGQVSDTDQVGFVRALVELLTPVARSSSFYTDPFYFKALVIEAVAWGLGGYAIGAYSEMVFRQQDYHLDQFALIKMGLICALALFLILSMTVFMILRGSSRAHRVMVESFVLFLIATPVAGVQIVSDINRSMDDSPALISQANVSSKEVRVSRRRRGGRSYSYYLHLSARAVDNAAKLPSSIKVDRELYDKVAEGQSLNFTIGPGRLGLQWYREIKPQ